MRWIALALVALSLMAEGGCSCPPNSDGTSRCGFYGGVGGGATIGR